MPLQWSEVRSPDDECSYTHIVSKTPLGDLTIEWKGWKDHDTPDCRLPWGDYVFGSDLDDAKAAVQKAWDAAIESAAALMSKPLTPS